MKRLEDGNIKRIQNFTLEFLVPKQKILVEDSYLLNVGNNEFVVEKQMAQILILIGFELKRL